VGEREGALAVSLPNEPHRDRAEKHRNEVEAAVATVAGRPVRLVLVAEGGGRSGRDTSGASPRDATPAAAPRTADTVDDLADHLGDATDVRSLPDVPRSAADTPIDRLTQAFPGAELVDDD